MTNQETKLSEILRENILKERPKLSDSYLKTYVSTLSSLYKRLDGKDISFFRRRKCKF